MELCTTRCTLSIPQFPLSFNHILPLKTPHLRFSHFPGVVCDRKSKVIRASLDENKSDKVATLEDDINDVRLDTVNSNEQKSGVFDVDNNNFTSVSGDDTFQPLQELLNNFNIQLDAEDTPTIILYGGGTLVAVWLLSAIVGAIDSIPVLPKLLEVVGLGYSVWFTTRYLLFKKNREELGSKIEELKQEILGSND